MSCLGAKDHLENCRPISLLPIVSKVFERCVLNSIKDHLYHVISPKQHGFCTGRSCVTNLLEALDQIGSLLDGGSQVDTSLPRYVKSFRQSQSKRRIVHQLIQAGFGGNLLNWFCSYLSSRRQRVTVLGATLEDLPVTSGVPKGSILGPALLLLYVNDLKSSVLAVECSCSLTNKNIQSDKDFRGMPLLCRETLGSLQLGLSHLVSFLTKLSVRRST